MAKKLHLALPAFNERDFLPQCITAIEKQDFQNFHLYIAVNQPKEYWEKPEKRAICENNQETLKYLKRISSANITVFDLASKNKAFPEKNSHVGSMRKFLMDTINKKAAADDIILSMDADTYYPENYLSAIHESFTKTKAVALSIPYYHKLGDDDNINRLMLRYEIYMRCYVINLWRISSPYCFSALGSAFALPIKSYNAINGITPKKSGEDFYFLQKLRKYGEILHWTESCAFPAARYSDRVFFGTGPALIKGKNKDWNSYPIYPRAFFEEIAATYELFPILYKENTTTPMDAFLEKQFPGEHVWLKLRKNFIREKDFVRACHQKIDALRILQFLKEKYEKNPELHYQNEENVVDLLLQYPEELQKQQISIAAIDFEKNSISSLQQIRNSLTNIENNYRRKHSI
jgi:hypothetical protein